MKSLTPNIFVDDMSKTVAFYSSLGFELTNKVPEEEGGELVWAMMTAGSVNIMFQSFKSLGDELPSISRNKGGSLLLYIQVEHIEELFHNIKDKVIILKGLEKTFYGANEFSIEDNNGYVLTFAESR